MGEKIKEFSKSHKIDKDKVTLLINVLSKATEGKDENWQKIVHTGAKTLEIYYKEEDIRKI